MAVVNFFDSFAYKWAQTGNADPIQDDQYKVGWAYIGSTPPSVEQFNSWGQLSDEKHNWLFGQLKAVTDNAGLVLAAGSSDTLLKAIQASTMLVLPTAPALQLARTIYAEDREQILRWKTLGAYTGYVSPDVGCISFGTQPDPRPFEVDLIGQTLDKTNPKYAALHAWGNAMGRFVAAGSWTAGTYFFCEMGGNLFRVPDLRNMFIRFTGTDIDTANVRLLASLQLDAAQRIVGVVGNMPYAGAPSGPFTATNNGTGISFNGSNSQTRTGDVSFDTLRSTARISTENRSVNVALHPRMRL